ncbi:hypothetical protein B0H14DRAFT_2583029 [Mycena olivaceomarginata]|nr:hypothetical protein B0H14DRAFT_2583029 [Mycena olivaceomarginata]
MSSKNASTDHQFSRSLSMHLVGTSIALARSGGFVPELQELVQVNAPLSPFDFPVLEVLAKFLAIERIPKEASCGSAYETLVSSPVFALLELQHGKEWKPRCRCTRQAINTRQPNMCTHRLVPPPIFILPASLSLASPNLRPAMSLVTVNGNLCPLCGSQLAVKVAAGGQMPGSRFLYICVPMLFSFPRLVTSLFPRTDHEGKKIGAVGTTGTFGR